MGFTCQKRTDSPVIARVGNAILTLEDLYERIPPEYSDHISREQKINYVKQWIDTELLFQEAMRQKIEKEPEIRARLAEMKKDLLSAEIISRNSFAASKSNVSEEAVRAYYDEHKDSLVRESDVIKYLEIVVADLKTAWDVRTMVTRDNFLDLAVRYSKSPVQDPRALPYVPVDELPPNVTSALSAIRINATSAPVEVNGGYHIIRILDKQKAGTPCSLEEVQEDIMSMLSTRAQKQHMDELLSNLRLKMDYEFHFEHIPGAEENTDSDIPG
jgi:parvulin-like peptidyl-prolyl isomerase